MAPGEEAKVTVKLVPEHKNSSNALLGGRTTWTIPVGITDWRNEDSSLKTHEPPDWVSSRMATVVPLDIDIHVPLIIV